MFGLKKKKGICAHKWKDFSWYLATETQQKFGKKSYFLRVYEPYVCIHCKERHDELIFEREFSSANDLAICVETFQKKYSQIKPIIEVNDEIADFQFVDRHYLAIAGVLKNENYDIPRLKTE